MEKNQIEKSTDSDKGENPWDDDPFAAIESLDFITSKFEKTEKQIQERENRRREYDKVYGNCFRKFQTEAEKTENFRQKKRKRREEKRKIKKELKKEGKAIDTQEKGRAGKSQRERERKRLLENRADGMRVVIDCGFEAQMGSKEMASLAMQIIRCYGRIRRSPKKYNLVLLNFKGIYEVDIYE